MQVSLGTPGSSLLWPAFPLLLYPFLSSNSFGPFLSYTEQTKHELLLRFPSSGLPSLKVTSLCPWLGTDGAHSLRSGGLPALSVRSSKALLWWCQEALKADFLLPVVKPACLPWLKAPHGHTVW